MRAVVRVPEGGLRGMGGRFEAVPINDYQYALNICGKKIVLTYKNIKEELDNKRLLRVVRVLMFISSMLLITGFLGAVGTVGHQEMLDELKLPQDMTFLQETVRLVIFSGISLVGGFLVNKFYNAEQVLLKRLSK